MPQETGPLVLLISEELVWSTASW